MRFLIPVPFRFVFAGGVVLAVVVVPGTESRKVVAADQGQAEQRQKLTLQKQTGRGRFVSFKDGLLSVQGREGPLAWNLPATTKAVQFNVDEKAFKPVGLTESLSQAKAGTWTQVIIDKEQNVTVRVGERTQKTTGTFVSFKDQRLLMLGTSLGDSYVKKYGNTVHFNKFFDDTPVEESVDGGEYQPIGLASTVLADVKEGTVVTIHAQGDDNITLVQLGVRKQK